jgi:hypothetical protein
MMPMTRREALSLAAACRRGVRGHGRALMVLWDVHLAPERVGEVDGPPR